MARKLTFITSNPSKAAQLSIHLDYPIEHVKVDLLEVQSLDLEEIIIHKAEEAYKIVKSPVLVEDTSLRFLSLGKLPGPLIKWFLIELGNDGLCNLLVGYTNRKALAEVIFCLYEGENYHLFNGSMSGTIATIPRGESGFGWDSIFIPSGYEQTWGEMNKKLQMKTSMRRIALKKMQMYINKEFND